jgi:hypothetical protein
VYREWKITYAKPIFFLKKAPKKVLYFVLEPAQCFIYLIVNRFWAYLESLCYLFAAHTLFPAAFENKPAFFREAV